MARLLASALVLVGVAGCRPHVDAAASAGRDRSSEPEIWEPTGWRASARIVNVQWTAGRRIFRQTTDGYEILDDEGKVVARPLVCPTQDVLASPPPVGRADPAFPWIVVPCSDGVHAVDPQTGLGRRFAPPADDVQVAEDAVLRVGTTFTTYDAALVERGTQTLPVAPYDWVTRKGVIAGVASTQVGSEAVWVDGKDQLHRRDLGDIGRSPVATDGERIVVETQATREHDWGSLWWLEAGTGESLGATHLIDDPIGGMGFVGSTLWGQVGTGWLRWNGPSEELPTVGAQLARDVREGATWSTSGAFAWTGSVVVGWDAEGNRTNPDAGAWSAVARVGVSRNGGTLVIVDTTGRVVVVRRGEGVVARWRELRAGTAYAQPSNDGQLVVESEAGMPSLTFRRVADGDVAGSAGRLWDARMFEPLRGGGQWTADDCFADARQRRTDAQVISWCPGDAAAVVQDVAWYGQRALTMTPAGDAVVTWSYRSWLPPSLEWWRAGPHAPPDHEADGPFQTMRLPEGTTDVWAAAYDDAGQLIVGLCSAQDCGVWHPSAPPVLGFGDRPEDLYLSADGAFVVAVDALKVDVYDSHHQLVRTAELVAKPVDVQMAATVAVYQLADDRIQVVPLRKEP